MIVNDEMVSSALAYLNDYEIAAQTRYNATKTKNAAEEIFARLFLSYNTGPVAEREARATCNPEYMEAKDRETEAERDLERHKSSIRNAEMVIEIWRTENANARAAERVR